MTTPINPLQAIDVMPVQQSPAEPRPDPHSLTPPVHRSGEVAQDQVTLKTSGQPDADNDRG